jgi:hypothetical protein
MFAGPFQFLPILISHKDTTEEGPDASHVRTPSLRFDCSRTKNMVWPSDFRQIAAASVSRVHSKALNPVTACPRIRVWMSCVPS